MTTSEGLAALLKEYEGDSKKMRHMITDIMWHMRGSLSREEAWTLSFAEREDIKELIEERMKVVEKTGLPII